MVAQDRYSKLAWQTFGDGYSVVHDDGYFSALNLWQDGPTDVGQDMDVAYFVEVICLTVTAGGSYYGTGSTRRLAGFALNGGTKAFSLLNQSEVEYLGGLVYPVLYADNSSPSYPRLQIQFRLTNPIGQYFHTRVWINILAHEPPTFAT